MASIQIEAWRLKTACENFLAKRETRIKHEQDGIINNQYVGKHKYWLFGARYTYETARKMLESSDYVGWHKITWKDGEWAYQAEQLLSLANNGDPVTLTQDDIWIMEYENA